MPACLCCGITEYDSGEDYILRKLNAKFNTAFVSEAGGQLKNKDYFAFVELDDFACYVIADSIDDDLDQESAKIAVAAIIREFSNKPSMSRRKIKNWIKTANRELLSLSRSLRLKASVLVMVTDYSHMIYGMAGNSRLRLFREGTLLHESRDHSLSNELMEQGRIPKDKVARHLERNNLYCYLGQPAGLNPEVSSRIKLAEGDSVALFTSGIWENVDDGELADALKESKEPQDFINNVEDLLLSRQPEKLENYTLATIFVDKIFQDPGRRKKLLKKILWAALPILIILAGLLLFIHISHAHRQQQVDEMHAHMKQAEMMSEQGNFPRAVEEYKTALDLAEKLKLPKEETDIGNYYKTASLILAGDMALQQKNFAKAAEEYKQALAASYLADKLGMDYIKQQQSLLADYMNIIDLLQSGDQKAGANDLIGARMDYLQAKVIASRLYDETDRKEAADKLSKLDTKMKEDDKKAKAQEGAAYEQQAAVLAGRGDYEGAVSMLTMASGIYDEAGNTEKSIADQQKIAGMEDKMSASEKAALQEKLNTEAQGYETQGDKLAEGGDYQGAQEQYGLALSLYNKSGNKEKTALLQNKISNVNTSDQNLHKFNLQRHADSMEKQGDLYAAENRYDDAANSYNLAMQEYGSAGLSENVNIVQKKLDSLNQKQTGYERQKTKAAAYVTDADAKVQAGDFVHAKYLYLLANDIYIQLNLKPEKAQVDEKIKLLQKLSKGAA
jgi:serine/threonine protein phosphatase PrpC